MCRAGEVREVTVPSTQFCCELKTPLKSKIFILKNERQS
jgi:hypothetical protein